MAISALINCLASRFGQRIASFSNKRGTLLALAVAFCTPAFGAPADDLRVLLQSGESAKAYAAGRTHPEEFGRGEFDFYFGIAAIDTGNAGEGVLALERYLLRFPDNTRARLELARGYFVLGELPRAREEFDAVASTKPPANVQATIDRFMDAIRARESRYEPTASGYLEVGGGVDTNVNSGIGGSTVNVPTLGTVELSNISRGQGDRYGHLGAGGLYSRPIRPGIAVFVTGSYEGKFNSDADLSRFNMHNLGVNGGATWLRERDLIRATLGYSTLVLDTVRFRDVRAVTGEWQRQVGEMSQFSASGQLATLSFPGSPIRDADFRGAGIGWKQGFVHRLQPALHIQASYGVEENDLRKDLSRTIASGRGSLSVVPFPRWSLSTGVTYAYSTYLGTDPIFQKLRSDGYVGIDAGVSYRLDRRWIAKGEFMRMSNSSNIALYSYDRNILAAKLRMEF